MERKLSGLAEALTKRDQAISDQFKVIQERFGHQRSDITDHHRWFEAQQGSIQELNEHRMALELKVMGMEDNLCRCGAKSTAVDEDLEYFTPLVAGKDSFPEASSSSSALSAPLPVPEPLPPADQSLPPSGQSDQENIAPRAVTPPQVLHELIPVPEENLMSDLEAEAVSDQMDEVRRHATLNQRARRGGKAKRSFRPYPIAEVPCVRHRGRDLGVEHRRCKTTHQLLANASLDRDGDADHESNGDSSLSSRGSPTRPRVEPSIRYMGCNWSPEEFFGLSLAVPN